MAQAVKCLLCKREALCSNPNPIKKKKRNQVYQAKDDPIV
jgi:hypothetical protein